MVRLQRAAMRSRKGGVQAWATALITTAVYGVLAYALSATPPAHLPPPLYQFLRAAPLIIAAINASALLCLQRGAQAIREGRVEVHRRFMLAAAVLISFFLILYVTRVALGGAKAFPGPAMIRRYLYLPALTVHVALSIVSVPLVVYNLLIGLTYDVRAIAGTKHPRVGRVAVTLWSVSLALGILVYLMLNVLF